MASIFNIGLSGLNAAQAGLITTSHNISNASTAGFSRQAIVQSTNPSNFSGAGFFGEGAKVDTVRRAYNQFLNNQVLAADTKHAEYDTWYTELKQIDNMLADQSSGLSPAVQDFFKGVQEVAANPSSVPARQAMLSSAQSLVGRFQSLNERLDEIRSGLEGQIAETTSQISAYATQIADMNQRIVVAQQGGAGQPANDLLDQRDQMIRELNQLTRVSTAAESDGSLSVFVGTGQPLVSGTRATVLATRPSPTDPQRLAVNMVTLGGASVAIPESLLGGGKLGGLLSMRATSLDSTQNQLGLVAVGVASAFNAQHALGQDLNGALGTDFFKQPEVQVQRANGTVADAPRVAFAAGGLGKLEAADYQLTFTKADGTYSLTRVSDGQAVDPAEIGLEIGTNGDNTLAGPTRIGDSFLIQGVRHAAADIGVAIADARMIAAAAPLAGSLGAKNLGSATMSPVTVSDRAAATSLQASPASFTFVAGTPPALSVSALASQPVIYTNASGVPTAYPGAGNIPFTNGMNITIGGSLVGGKVVGGASFTLSGAPKDFDSFTVGANASGISDGRNVVLLGELQTKKTMLSTGEGATATLQSVYSQLVAKVGNKTRELEVSSEAQATLVAQATNAQAGVAGVNLDEEAANLIRYQQAYQASGRVMSVAAKLFEQVLALGQ